MKYTSLLSLTLCLASCQSLGPDSAINFERPVKFVFSEKFTAWATSKKTLPLWERAAQEAPLLFNDRADKTLPPLMVNVVIADDEVDPASFAEYCTKSKYQAFTPYGTPTIYICAQNKFDEPPGPNQEERRADPWRGLWSRIAFLGHEAGHGLTGAFHSPKGEPAIMCGWPNDDPNTCYAELTGFTSVDRSVLCGGRSVTGGFCSHIVAPLP